MHSALTTRNVLVIVILVIISVQGFPRRANAVSEKKIGCQAIFSSVQGKIGAPYRDMTQIGWQV